MEETTTTKLARLKLSPHLFTWGRLVRFYDVGPYCIAEYVNKRGDTLYYGWAEGKDTCTSWESLDAALVGCIAYRREGPNSQAGHYFIRMVGGHED